MADPNILGLEQIVRSFRQACAGVAAGRMFATAFARQWLGRYGQDPSGVEQFVDEVWDDEKPADDLRKLALVQAQAYRNEAFDHSMSENHPDRIAMTCQALEEGASELEAWANRPRQDFLPTLVEEEIKWPWKLVYEEKHGARNASRPSLEAMRTRSPDPTRQAPGTNFDKMSGS